MSKKKDLSILFIGDGHTCYNDMMRLVKLLADDGDYNCRVTMPAHPTQYADEPEARFNILYE